MALSQHRLAVLSAVVLAAFYLVVLCPGFLGTANPEQTDARQAFIPVQTLHFFDDGLEPLGSRDRRQAQSSSALRMESTADPARKVRVAFLAPGPPYRIFGLIPSTTHLIGRGLSGTAHFPSGVGSIGPRPVVTHHARHANVDDRGSRGGRNQRRSWRRARRHFRLLRRRRKHQIIQRLIELLQSVPTIPIWLALSAALPRDWTPIQVFFAITVILSLIGWTTLGREVRGRFLALREEDFVLAARLAGCGRMRIILRHMVPTFLSHIIATRSLAIPVMIINETSLSFLGLGIRPPAISWGVLLQEAQNIQTLALAPWLLIPGLVVIIAVLAFNLVGDGLRDASDPYSH